MVRATFAMRVAATATLAMVVGACTVKKQEAPSLSGPSELGKSIAIAVAPDVVTQDGASQSTITITARDAAGQPLRNLPLRVDIAVNGTLVEGSLGTLSARNVVTDTNGRAVVTYTAPPLPQGVPVSAGTIQIVVTPTETDFGNSTPRTASIRLVLPPGAGGGTPPCTVDSNLTITATPSAPVDHQAVVFEALAPAGSAPIVSFAWSFGDGGTGSGRTTQHAYGRPGVFSVSVTATDAVGAAICNSISITVGQGQAPTASFVFSPTAPVPNQQVFFNASASLAAPGRRIVSYRWDFGDGTSGSGVQTSHTYTVSGGYNVTLKVTDDAGNVGTITQSITIGADAPQAQFTVSPTSPTVGAVVNFNGTGSTAVPGRTITSYTWNFGDGTTGTGATTTHTFTVAGTFNVTLTVVDSQGKSGSVTTPVTIGP